MPVRLRRCPARYPSTLARLCARSVCEIRMCARSVSERPVRARHVCAAPAPPALSISIAADHPHTNSRGLTVAAASRIHLARVVIYERQPLSLSEGKALQRRTSNFRVLVLTTQSTRWGAPVVRCICWRAPEELTPNLRTRIKSPNTTLALSCAPANRHCLPHQICVFHATHRAWPPRSTNVRTPSPAACPATWRTNAATVPACPAPTSTITQPLAMPWRSLGIIAL